MVDRFSIASYNTDQVITMNRLLLFVLASVLITNVLISTAFAQGFDRSRAQKCCNIEHSAAQTQKRAEFAQFAEACQKEIGK